jgi:argininosuccinate synthase
VIAPWREWDLTSRTALIAWAEAHQIQVPKDKRGESPFSTDANLLHTSSEGKVLEDPWEETPDYVYSRTVNPEDAPDVPEYITIDFERGDGVALNGEAMSPPPCWPRSTNLAASTASAGSIWSRTASSA